MKRENKGIKKLIACLMCVVMIGSAIACMPEFLASATEGTATEAPKQTYGEWKDATPVNGSFEVGVEGEEVYGWSKTAIDYNTRKKVEEEDIDLATTYCNQYTLTTAEESGNKVAALKKNGAGYVAATSQPISVTGGQYYRMSFDYKTVSTENVPDAINGTNYFGVRFFVEELDSTGQIAKELTLYYSDPNKSNTWNTGTIELETQENTASVVIYLWVGGQWNMYATVYFDNVSVKAYQADEIVNGDFESQTTEINKRTWDNDASKEVNLLTNAPTGWTMYENDDTGTVDAGNPANTGGNTKYHAMEKVQDEQGDYCMKMYPCYNDGKTYGMVRAQSNYMAVEGGQFHTVSYDLKVEGKTALSKYNPKMIIYYYDSAKTQIATTTNAHTYDVTTWTRFNFTDEAPEGAKYMTVNFYIGGARSDSGMVHYIDNVSVKTYQVDEVVNGDFESQTTTIKKSTINGQIDTNAPADWTMYECDETGTTSANGGNHAYYVMEKAGDETGNHYMKMYPCYGDGKTYGMVRAQSNYMPVEGGQFHTVSYDLKVEGKTALSKYNPKMIIYYYDSAKTQIATTTNAHTYDVTTWTRFNFMDKAPEGAKYMTVNFYIGGARSDNGMVHYIDNVSVKAYQADELVNGDFSAVNTTGVAGWNLVSCFQTGSRLDGNYTGNYVLSTVQDGTTNASYMKLKSNGNATGYVLAQSNYITVTGGQALTVKYDLKLEGSAENDYATPRMRIYYYDSDKTHLSNANVVVAHDYSVTDWTSFTCPLTVPDNAEYMTVNFYMGGNNNNVKTHYIDNVSVEETVIDTDSLKTDLLFVMLQGGNAVDATESEGLVDICDLIHMKKYIAGEADAILETADMNNNRGTIGEKTVNNDDVLLLEWKLLGVTTTEQAKSVQ